jgi:hypothetical protein
MAYVDYFDYLLLMGLTEILHFLDVYTNLQFENDDLVHPFMIDIDYLINLSLLIVMTENLVYYFFYLYYDVDVVWIKYDVELAHNLLDHYRAAASGSAKGARTLFLDKKMPGGRGIVTMIVHSFYWRDRDEAEFLKIDDSLHMLLLAYGLIKFSHDSTGLSKHFFSPSLLFKYQLFLVFCNIFAFSTATCSYNFIYYTNKRRSKFEINS